MAPRFPVQKIQLLFYFFFLFLVLNVAAAKDMDFPVQSVAEPPPGSVFQQYADDTVLVKFKSHVAKNKARIIQNIDKIHLFIKGK